jgi:hypothetical protein
MFFTTLIGGNTPVLVPWVRNLLKASTGMATISFEAASTYQAVGGMESVAQFQVEQERCVRSRQFISLNVPINASYVLLHACHSASSLQYAMVYLFIGLYLSSALLFVLTAWIMYTKERDLKSHRAVSYS